MPYARCAVQFSMGELRAIVEEAEASRTYVCAHAYTAEAVHRAVEAGCRSIEHGNYAHRLRPDIRVNVLAGASSRCHDAEATFAEMSDDAPRR